MSLLLSWRWFTVEDTSVSSDTCVVCLITDSLRDIWFESRLINSSGVWYWFSRMKVVTCIKHCWKPSRNDFSVTGEISVNGLPARWLSDSFTHLLTSLIIRCHQLLETSDRHLENISFFYFSISTLFALREKKWWWEQKEKERGSGREKEKRAERG